MCSTVVQGVVAALLASLAAGQRIQTVEVADSRYFISNASPYSPQLNWFLAYEYCRTIGMELLSLERLEETQELNDFLTNNNHLTSAYWTSGNQLGSAMWIWMSTGQPFNTTFNFWAAGGAPLTKSEESCMSSKGGDWWAENCMEEKHFICEQTRCFYYNYVTTNRGTTQGNKTIIPGINQVLNRPPPHPLRPLRRPPPPPPVDPVQEQQLHQQTQQDNQSLADPTATSPSASNQSITTQSRVSAPSLNNSATPSPLKIMSLIQPDNKVRETLDPEQVKTMPPTPQQIEVMTSTKLKAENPANATYTNEIFPNPIISHLQLLQPPTQEFTPSEPEIVKHTNKTLAGILSRKETFSWALKDHSSQ